MIKCKCCGAEIERVIEWSGIAEGKGIQAGRNIPLVAIKTTDI